MLIDKATIRGLIPHAGAMCLLDAVAAWDERSIACLTESHRDPANPLRAHGRRAALHAIEYGAQAAAIHGALCARAAGQTAVPGYLAALRDARWFVPDLGAVAAPLEVVASPVLGEVGHWIYAIRISAAGRVLAEARIIIALRAVSGGEGA